MRNGRYGCAVWGCGWVSSGHIHAYLQHPQCEVVGLGSRNEESVRRKQQEFGLETAVYRNFAELLNDDRVDIVSICTPNYLHAGEAMAAAHAGKHVFLEKPIGISETELDDLATTFAASGVRSMVGFVLRFNPLVNMQRRLIAEGELGRVFMANVDYWFGRERLGWMREGSKTGGAFILAGCHSVDMVRYLLDSDIVAVSGQSVQVGGHYDYPPVETAQVRFANGAIGVFSCSLVGCSPYTANVSVLGEEGTLCNDRFYLRRFAGQSDFFQVDAGGRKSGDIYSHPFPEMVAHFVRCLNAGEESPHNIASALNAHRACLAICRSAAENGRWLELEPGRGV